MAAKRKPLTDEQKRSILEMLSGGFTDADIASFVGVSERSVRNVQRDARAAVFADNESDINKQMSPAQVLAAIRQIRSKSIIFANEMLPRRIEREIVSGRSGKDIKDLATAMGILADKAMATHSYLEKGADIPGKVPEDAKGKEKLRRRLLLGHAKYGSTRAAVELSKAIGLSGAEGDDYKVVFVDVGDDDRDPETDQAASSEAATASDE